MILICINNLKKKKYILIMDRTQILRAFNDHFIELIEDIERAFPENKDIKTLKNLLHKARKANPRMILTLVKTRILSKYRDKIENSDLSFFIEKDYSNDLSEAKNSSIIINKLEQIRGSIRDMDDSEKEKVLKYLKNLVRLSDLYK